MIFITALEVILASTATMAAGKLISARDMAEATNAAAAWASTKPLRIALIITQRSPNQAFSAPTSTNIAATIAVKLAAAMGLNARPDPGEAGEASEVWDAGDFALAKPWYPRALSTNICKSRRLCILALRCNLFICRSYCSRMQKCGIEFIGKFRDLNRFGQVAEKSGF